uniref:Protein kinase domain-containing protein n=1 Tax=Maylandia zebra TaxID=106582 RepID=A0A3P9DVA2_9CICH
NGGSRKSEKSRMKRTTRTRRSKRKTRRGERKMRRGRGRVGRVRNRIADDNSGPCNQPSGQRLFVSLIKQMLALDAHQRITPSEVLRHPFFSPKSSLCIDMSAEISQNPVVFQHPSNLESKRSQKINCSFQNSVEFSQQVFVHTSASPSFSSDELELVKGSILGKHYKVEAFLGEGGFGIVAKCRDTTTNQAVAIKVNKSDPDILQQAHVEIFILEQLRRLDPDAANIVQWNGFFHDGQRVCLKFELLDQCLWDYIGDRNKQGLPISEVRPILGQITNALSHLSSVGIVHADLKPGNIMVVNRHESPIKVKLIDFGLACPASAVIPGDFVGTVGYCAPEVMLGLPYNEASDMWSLGLVAVELATGLPLYPSENDYDYLKFIIETQGPEAGQRLFVSLIKQMLALDAHQRITPSQVLRHPFFSPGLSKRFPCINIERPY